MPRTGAKNTVAGIYRCGECGERITMALGKEFPDCPKCKKAVNWVLVTATKR
jgi:ABC-type ATPase with predicted acetyltransferase domain